MEELVIVKIKSKLNTKEKIIFKIFKKTCIKIYRLGMIECFKFYN